MEIAHLVDSSEKTARRLHTKSGLIYTDPKPLLTFHDFTGANVSITEGQIVLNVSLTGESALRVQAFTRKHVGDRLAYIVNGQAIRTPKILDPITGKGILIGPFPMAEGQKLADAINSSGHGCDQTAAQ